MTIKFSWWDKPQAGKNGSYRRYQTRLGVILSKRGEIMLTNASWEALGKPKHVVPGSGDAGQVGIRSTTSTDTSGYIVGDLSGKGMHRITCKSFSASNGLVDTEVCFYPAHFEGNILVFSNQEKEPARH